ncbi:MAG: hypothetical protein HC831_02135, partial [Chloroflexia bacterium]|nr:hypothetical protein [Chloroflexia bacterium]
RAYRNLTTTQVGVSKLEKIWRDEMKIKDLILSEEDKITLAYELAIKNPEKEKYYLEAQVSETKNPDRKERMEFVMPAISNDQLVRDDFFNSLKQEVNREHEPWVLEAYIICITPYAARIRKNICDLLWTFFRRFN